MMADPDAVRACMAQSLSGYEASKGDSEVPRGIPGKHFLSFALLLDLLLLAQTLQTH